MFVFLPETLTANFQLTLDRILPAVVDCLTHVNSAIKGTRFTDLQCQNTVLTEHPVLGLMWDIHLVLVPGHFRLTGRDTEPNRPMKKLEGLKNIKSCFMRFYLCSTLLPALTLKSSTYVKPALLIECINASKTMHVKIDKLGEFGHHKSLGMHTVLCLSPH